MAKFILSFKIWSMQMRLEGQEAQVKYKEYVNKQLGKDLPVQDTKAEDNNDKIN